MRRPVSAAWIGVALFLAGACSTGTVDRGDFARDEGRAPASPTKDADAGPEATEHVVAPTPPRAGGTRRPGDPELPVTATTRPGEPVIPTAPAPATPIAPTQAAPTAPPVDLFTGTTATARDVANALMARAGDGRPLQLNLYRDYAFLTTARAADVELTDRWTWRASATGGDPQISGPEPLPDDIAPNEPRLFDLGAVALEQIPTLATQTVAELAYPEAAVTHVIVQSNLPFDSDIVIRVYAGNDTSSGRVDHHADGRVKRVFR